MDTKSQPSIVFIHVKLPFAINERQALNHPTVSAAFAEVDNISRDLEKLFFDDKSQGLLIKVAEGAFFADEDAWYPNIHAMMKWCDDKKYPYVIVPVGDAAATLSAPDEAVAVWLRGKGKRARLSGHPPLQQMR